jgi:hypothetical protein
VYGIAIGRSSWASRDEAMTSESERSQLRERPWLRYEREKKKTESLGFGGSMGWLAAFVYENDSAPRMG